MILLQYNLDSKYRCLVQALTFVYKGYPNYIVNMFRIKHYPYNLCFNDRILDKPQPPKLVLNMDLFCMLRAASRTITFAC